MKKGIVLLVTVVLVGGAATGGYFYLYKNGKLPGSTERVSSDSADAVYVDSVAELAGLNTGDSVIQRYAGVIEAMQTWEVKLENERTVDECFVKEGDEVKEGQKLFTYNTTDDEDKLVQAQIELERLQNEIETTQASKAQLEKEKRSASSEDQLSYTQQILSAETQIKTSEYELRLKQAEMDQLKEKVADASVYSEINGVVKSINDPNSSSNSYLSDSSSDSAYITVLEVGDYRVKGTVNEQNMSQITEGMEMIVHSRVDESLTWHGVITEINRDKGETNSSSSYYGYGAASDNGTSSTNYPYYVELDSSDGLMLGQHVYMEPDVGQTEERDGIWLDEYYFVTEEDGSAYVWASSAANVLEKRAVTLGEYDEDLASYQVLEGLTEEDWITVPYEELAEGLPVIYNEYTSGEALDGSYDLEGGGLSYDGLSYDGEEYEDGMSYDGAVYDDGGMDDSVQYADGGFYDADAQDGEVYDADVQDGEVYDADVQDGDVYDADALDGGEMLDGMNDGVIEEK